MWVTCKKASEEFIYGTWELLIAVVGFEIYFSSNGDTIHINLHKQAFSRAFWFFTFFGNYLLWFRSRFGGAACNILPEGANWRPSNHRNSGSSFFLTFISFQRGDKPKLPPCQYSFHDYRNNGACFVSTVPSKKNKHNTHTRKGGKRISYRKQLQ